MRRGYYSTLALEGIRKNRRLYRPYFLACSLMVAMFYILAYLSQAAFMPALVGGGALALVMRLGSFVIATFSVLFLFYTNAFLIRRRKKEFGLYNILGMDKRSIGRVLFIESLMTALLSLAIGLGAGIALSKMAELGMNRLVQMDVTYTFTVPPRAIKECLIIFGVLFFLIFLNGLRQVRFSKPVELIRSENLGEKPPKANWVLGLLGFILLGAAYYIAVTIKNPIQALSWFFVAVIMVIVATYMIFIAGSVLLCRVLQKNKHYYYNKKHFVSVSSMTYRMKRNGAGLASICILLTMVLVMISSTACLYYGMEDSLNTRYPRALSVNAYFKQAEQAGAENTALLRKTVLDVLEENGAAPLRVIDCREAEISGKLDKSGRLDPDASGATVMDLGSAVTLHLLPLEDYQGMTGDTATLGDGEAMAFSTRKQVVPETVTVGSRTYRVVKTLESLEVEGLNTVEVLSNIYLIVPDFEAAVRDLGTLTDSQGRQMLLSSWRYAFDTDLEPRAQIGLRKALSSAMSALKEERGDLLRSTYSESLEADRMDFYGTYGGLFFLAILLSLVFLVAAVLIIYYKQISEGYEDQSRFDIMQKVGMTKEDIRKSINSQMLTVFYLPIVFAALHLVFAFPMIRKILILFNLNNLPLLILTTALSVLAFSLLYALVYRVTSNAYYAIVSDARAE